MSSGTNEDSKNDNELNNETIYFPWPFQEIAMKAALEVDSTS